MKFILSMVIIFCFFSVFATDESIVINEICVKPEKKEHPKWIELRCLSKVPVNLKGWSLHDTTGKFYEFSKDLVLNPNQLLLLLFYAGDKPSSDFEKQIPKNAKRINVLNSNPFGSLGEFYIKAEACEKYSKTFNFSDVSAVRITKDLAGTEASFNDFKIKAENYIKDKKYPDSYLLYIICCMAATRNYESDEVAIFDENNIMRYYLNWGNDRGVKLAKGFSFESKADELGLHSTNKGIPGSIGSGLDESSKFKTMVFERSDGGTFCWMEKGSPGSLFFKDKLSEISLGGYFFLSYRCSQTLVPWWLKLELSKDKTFKLVDYSRSFHIKDPSHTLVGFWIEDDDLYWLFNKTDGDVYYRARRIFDDGELTDWTYSGNPFNFSQIIVDYKVKNIEELIQLHEKEIRARYFEEFKRLKEIGKEEIKK